MPVLAPLAFAPVSQVVRPVIADSEKRFLSAPEELLAGVAERLTARERAALTAEFGAYLGHSPYPAAVGLRLLDWVAAIGYPDLPLSAARRRHGREGLMVWRRQSILGRVMTAAFPLMGLDRILRRLPQNAAALTNFGTRWVMQEGPQHWWYCTSDDPTPPDFFAGVLDALTDFTAVQGVSITWETPSSHKRIYEIRWTG